MTSAALIFNPIRYTKKLVEVGFTQKQAELQAEAQAEAINEIVDEKLATKHDIELVKRDIKELDLKIEMIRREIRTTGAVIVGCFAVMGVFLPIAWKLLGIN